VFKARMLGTLLIVALMLPVWLVPLHQPDPDAPLARISHSIGAVRGPQVMLEDIEPPEKVRMINHILRVLDIYWTDVAAAEKLRFAEFLYEESVAYKLDPMLILAVIKVESTFDVNAISSRGARGLMQLLPVVAHSRAEVLGLKLSTSAEIFDPYLNVRLGVNYLAHLRDRFRDLNLALEAYYLGPTAVYELMSEQELSLGYARRVLLTYHRFRRS